MPNPIRDLYSYGTRVVSSFRALFLPRQTTSDEINREQEMPILQEQLKFYQGSYVRRYTPLTDNLTGETMEMRYAYRTMISEPTVKAALIGKIGQVASLDLRVIPENTDDPAEKACAEYCQNRLLSISNSGLPSPSASGSGTAYELVWPILSGGLMDGFSVSEKLYGFVERGKDKGKWSVRALKAKDTRFMQFLVDPYRNVTGIYSMMGNSGATFDPKDFVVFSYLSFFSSPTGMSDLRAVYRCAQTIVAALKLRMLFLDTLTGPYIKGIYKDPAYRAGLEKALSQARGRGWITLQEGTDVEVLNLAMSGTADFQAAIDDMRKEVAIGLKGAFLDMLEGTSPENRGSSSVHKETSEVFVWLLAVLVQGVVNEQIIPDLVDPNFGPTIALPRCQLGAVDPAEILKELDIDKALLGMGLDLSKKDLYHKSNRVPPRDAQDVLKGQAPQQPPGMPGGMPMPQQQPPAQFAEWEEDKHPRDGGKFAAKPGSDSKSTDAPTEPSKPLSRAAALHAHVEEGKRKKKELFEQVKTEAKAKIADADKIGEDTFNEIGNIPWLDSEDPKNKANAAFAGKMRDMEELAQGYDSDWTTQDKFEHFKEIGDGAKSALVDLSKVKPLDEEYMGVDEIAEAKEKLTKLAADARAARQHLREFSTLKKELSDIRDAGKDQDFKTFSELSESFVEFEESDHPRKGGKFASKGGGDSGASEPKGRMAKLLEHAKKLPIAVKDKAAAFVSKQYGKLSQRYGPTGAKLVLVGMCLPLPGSSIGAPLLAEGIKRLRLATGFAESDMSDEELAAAIRENLEAFYADLGEPMPELSDDDIAEAVKQAKSGSNEIDQFDERAGLVRKKIVDKNGRQTTRWVNPHTGEDHGEQHPETGESAEKQAKPKKSNDEKTAAANKKFEELMSKKTPADAKAFRQAKADGIAIPPAWTEVVYHGKGENILAEGRDDKGRKQRAENPAYRQRISDENNARITKTLAPRMPELRKKLRVDAEAGNEEAKVLYLISLTGFRIGGKGDGKAKSQAFGASTLTGDHVHVDGDTVTFDFPGKKGVRQQHSVTDPVVAKMMEGAQPGKPVFATRDTKVRAAWQDHYGGEKVHDIRHVVASEVANKELDKLIPPPPASESKRKALIKEVATLASHTLGNDPAQTLGTYIDPRLWDRVKVAA